MIIFISPSKHW